MAREEVLSNRKAIVFWKELPPDSFYFLSSYLSFWAHPSQHVRFFLSLISCFIPLNTSEEEEGHKRLGRAAVPIEDLP